MTKQNKEDNEILKTLSYAIDNATQSERARILGIIKEMQKQNSMYLQKALDFECRKGELHKEDLKRKESLIKIWKALIDYTKELTSKIKGDKE